MEDEERGKWSANEIARRSCVSHTFVNNIKVEIKVSLETVSSEIPRTYTTKHGTTATMNTQNIGKSKADEWEEVVDEAEALAAAE